VDAQPVRDHIAALMAAGLSLRRIAHLAGLNRKVVQVLLHGRGDRGTGPSKTVWPATAEKILAVPIPPTPHALAADRALMWDYGTTRRLRALVAIGYPQYYLAERIGVSPSNATRLFNPPKRTKSKHRRKARVTAATARRVEAVYRELENTPGPSQIARTRAKNLGWLPPIAWDEDNIDRPEPWLERQVVKHLTS
jgi:hypothetical protein